MRVLVLLALLAGCASAPAPAPPARLSYIVAHRGDALNVLVLGSGPLPVGRWRIDARRSLKLTGWSQEAFQTTTAGTRVRRVELQERDGVVDVPDAGLVGLSYTVPLVESGLEQGAGGAGSWVLASTSYLLRPVPVPPGMRVTLGTSALLPWTPDELADLPGELLAQPRFHAFGGRRRSLEVGGGSIEVALQGEFASSDDELVAWVRQAADELLTVTDPLPLRRITVALVPCDSSAASPFGMQSWGTIAVLTGTRARPDDLRRDWVLVHELMHLVHPRFEEPWLTEGFATYLSVIGRLRSGRMAEEEAWWEVLDGATDGRRRAGNAGLLELSRAMHEVHAYRSVYWGGAMFALDLDLTIRKVTGGTRSLEGLLDGLRGRRAVTLESLQQATDALTGARTFAAVLARHAEGPALSSASGLLGRLGVVWGEDGRLELRDGPDAALRAALKLERLP